MVATVSNCQTLDRRGGSYRVNDGFLLGYVVATVSIKDVLGYVVDVNGIIMAKDVVSTMSIEIN